MKLLIDLPKNINKDLKVLKAQREYTKLQEVIIDIIEDYFKKQKGGTA